MEAGDFFPCLTVVCGGDREAVVAGGAFTTEPFLFGVAADEDGAGVFVVGRDFIVVGVLVIIVDPF